MGLLNGLRTNRRHRDSTPDQAAAPAQETDAEGAARTPRATGYLQTASRLHAFNRYEIKYLVDEFDVPRLHEELVARMDTDPYSPIGGYPVTSLYYDTADLRFYWEKIEGLKFRRKLRMRYYGAPDSCTDDTEAQVEITQRVNRVTQKRRLPLPYGTARRWLDERESVTVEGSRPQAFVNEVTTLLPTDLRRRRRAGSARRSGRIGADQRRPDRRGTEHRCREHAHVDQRTNRLSAVPARRKLMIRRWATARRGSPPQPLPRRSRRAELPQPTAADPPPRQPGRGSTPPPRQW